MTTSGARQDRGAISGSAWWVAFAVLAVMAALSYRHAQDVSVFWAGARRLVAGADMFPVADGFLAWRYLPGTALLFTPIAAVPLSFAKGIWLAALAVIGAGVIGRLVARAPDPRPRLTALLVLAMVSRPLLEEFACGQVNLVVLLVLVLAFEAEDRGRPVWSGILLALAVGLKLSPAILLAEAALHRRWRVVAGGAAGIAMLVAAPLPFYGAAGTLALHGSWVRSLVAASPVLAATPGNQSLFALVARLGGPPALAVGLSLLVILVALLRPSPEPRRSLLVFITAMASPMGWIQNFVMAIPAAAMVARDRHRHAAAALGLALLVPIYDVTGPRLETWFFGHSLPLAAMALLFAAVVGRGSPDAEQHAGGWGDARADDGQWTVRGPRGP